MKWNEHKLKLFSRAVWASALTFWRIIVYRIYFCFSECCRYTQTHTHFVFRTFVSLTQLLFCVLFFTCSNFLQCNADWNSFVFTAEFPLYFLSLHIICDCCWQLLVATSPRGVWFTFKASLIRHVERSTRARPKQRNLIFLITLISACFSMFTFQ